MDEDVACRADDVTTAGGGQAWQKLLLGGGGAYEVAWDTAAVTPIGLLVHFGQYLSASGLLDGLVADCPLEDNSGNAPGKRAVIGTMILAILNGQTRYAHINAVRQDRVSAEVLNVKKLVSEDSVRRALLKEKEEAWDGWLGRHERAVWELLLAESYVLDIDNTVKPLYGHQEGAELGYNPQQPGRPSHNDHTYFIGSLRLVLGVEVHGGKQHAGRHSMPGLWALLDGLPAACRPRLIRGDVSYGNEQTMLAAESRGQGYLLKLRQTTKVRAQIERLERTAEAWSDAGEGWQGTEMSLKLMGWTRSRRCLFLRRPAERALARPALPASTEFDFVQVLDHGPCCESIVLVTNAEMALSTLAQAYRDRADCENVFDEVKNQWGGPIRYAGSAPLPDHGSADCPGLQLGERFHPARATGPASGGGHFSPPVAACGWTLGHKRPPQDRAVDLPPCHGGQGPDRLGPHRRVFQPPEGYCGAVEPGSDLDHHFVGSFPGLAQREAPAPGR